MAKFDDLVAARQGRSIAPYALFAVDIDDFRGVNDRLGPLAADRALYLVGACIRAALPVGVAVARVGADVFVALAPGMEAGEATLPVERLLGGLKASSIGLGLPVLGYKLGAVAVAGTDVDPAAAVRLVEQRAQDPATTSEGGAAEITSGSSALVPAPDRIVAGQSSPAQSLEVSEWASALETAIEAGAYIAVGEPLRAMHDGLAATAAVRALRPARDARPQVGVAAQVRAARATPRPGRRRRPLDGDVRRRHAGVEPELGARGQRVDGDARRPGVHRPPDRRAPRQLASIPPTCCWR